MSTWQVQHAKSRFSELLDKTETEGPQTITRHGAEKAVVMSIDEYRRLSGTDKTFVQHLLDFPKFEDFEIPAREIEPDRDINLFR